MLGKLFSRGPAAFSSTANTSSSSLKNPDSIQEDLHTRNMLFPDTQALYEHRHDQVFPLAAAPSLPSSSTSNAFDYDGDIELEDRDIRILIMQGATPSNQTTTLLYDSHAPHALQAAAAAEQQAAQEARRNPTSPRKSSLSHARPVIIHQDVPTQVSRHMPFERRASIQSRVHSCAETDTQRGLREYRDELATFSSCVFANSEIMSYKGTSTKVHVIPSEARPHEFSTSYVGDGRGSIGRSSTRSSKLAQSFTSEVLSPPDPNPNPAFLTTASTSTPRLSGRRKVLITRLFPVHCLEESSVNPPNPATTNTSTKTTDRGPDSEDNPGFPFPKPEDDPSAVKAKLKSTRTPMYAVALVIQLPRAPAQPAAPRGGFRGSSSYTEHHDSLPSSYNSTRRSGWTVLGGGHGNEFLESTYSSDMEDQIETVTQRWDVIMRTLTRLQSVVATKLSPLLRDYAAVFAADHNAVQGILQTQTSHAPGTPGRRYEDKKSKSATKPFPYILLPSNCLAKDAGIIREVDTAKTRIVSGLKATRVVTGQGRWGIWREEARTMARMTGGRDQYFFFYTLLTGFLSTHTDWLQALSPVSYRKRHSQQQRSKGGEDMLLPARTIIVAQDKIAARRLVFLLSAFLPASHQLPTIRTHRPSTAASTGTFSQSPPSGVVPILREESLRRKINRRSGPGVGPRQHIRSFSIQSQTAARPQGIPPPLVHLAFEGGHDRKSSDLSLMRHAAPPSAVGGDLTIKKSSAATTATVTPEASMPHFSRAHRRTNSRASLSLRPGSSGSLATDDLKRSLTRCDSTGQASIMSNDSRGQPSRWSVISGLWSPRRRESPSWNSQTTPTNTRDGPMSPTRPRDRDRPPGILSSVVVEPDSSESRDVFPPVGTAAPTPTQPSTVAPAEVEAVTTQRSLSKRAEVQGAFAFDSPVKTSVGADGVIDVDISFPDYLTSFETAVSSPSSSGYLSTPGVNTGLETFEQSSRSGLEGDLPFNVAGWLQGFHPDFNLQAIPPGPDLLEQVKAALRAEPTPKIPSALEPKHPLDQRWVDVSSALVADMTTFSIVRIRYKRLVRPVPLYNHAPYTTVVTPSVPPYEAHLEEKFIEEPVVTFEEVFTEAVERVISQTTTAPASSVDASTHVSASNDNSANVSASSSRSASKRRDRRDSFAVPSSQDIYIPESTLPLSLTPQLPPMPTEVPRSQCRTVVLSALEELVLDVVEKRKREGKQDGTNKVPLSREKESVLRETIRSWLDLIDLADEV